MHHPHLARHQAVLGGPAHAHGDIGVAARQIGVAVGDGQLHHDPGVTLMKLGQYGGQNLDADAFGRRQADHACGLAPGAGHIAQGRGDGRGHVFQTRLHLQRQIGGLEPPRRAQEERRPQALFQRLDVAPDSGLGHAAPPGGGRKAALLKDGVQALEQVPVGLGSGWHDIQDGRSAASGQ